MLPSVTNDVAASQPPCCRFFTEAVDESKSSNPLELKRDRRNIAA
jgi:hypothetical protein